MRSIHLSSGAFRAEALALAAMEVEIELASRLTAEPSFLLTWRRGCGSDAAVEEDEDVPF